MPSRGTPWRGVGKGVPDRIGTAAIADGSITEVDLDTALQAKVNAGGGIDHFAQTELLDDFFYTDPGSIIFLTNFKYITVNGTSSTATIDQPQSGALLNGVVFLEVNSTLSGQGSAFRNNDPFSGGSNFNAIKNTTMRIRMALVSTLTTRVDAMGLVDDNFSIFGGVTGVSNIDNSVDEGFYFKKESGGNWIAVSHSTTAGTQTDTDTGVSATVNVFQDFEIIHTTGGTPTDVFKIDGATVATHTTNVTNVNKNLFIDHTIVGLGAGIDRSIEIDLWHVVGDR